MFQVSKPGMFLGKPQGDPKQTDLPENTFQLQSIEYDAWERDSRRLTVAERGSRRQHWLHISGSIPELLTNNRAISQTVKATD